MEKHYKELQNAIHIRNEFNRVAAPIVEHAKEISKKFIGKKINTQKGLSEKFRSAFNFDHKSIQVTPIEGARWANVSRVYMSNSYSDLQIEIQLCFSDGTTGCTYESRTYYFGKTQNDVLVSINDDCKVSSEVLDYITELNAIITFRELEKAMENAKDKIRIGSEVYQYIP